MLRVVLILLVFGAHAAFGQADIDRYVNDETLLVASAKIEAGQGSALRNLLMLLPSASPTDLQFAESLAGLDDLLTGVTEASLILSTADLFDRSGPIVVLELAEETDAQALAKQLRTIFKHGAPLEEVAKLKGQRLALVNNPTLRRAQRMTPIARPDLTEPLAKLRENNSAAAVLSPGPDARRALRELWPGLPAPFAELTGPIVADGVRSITLAGTKERVELRVEAADATVAEKLEKLADTYIKSSLARASVHAESAPLPGLIDKFVKIDRAENILHWPINLTELRADAEIQRVFVVETDRIRDAASLNLRANHMKQFALGMLNFESSHGVLPAAAAIVSETGQPLLSWRVAVLPWMEEDQLFQEFHLDEPWDSPHNLELVKRMPACYANPLHPEQSLKGETTYLVPVHPESVFLPADQGEVKEATYNGRKYFARQGIPYREIRDGTDNTLMLVEVAPENAVPWTKPQDWEVDLAQPLAGIRHSGAKRFITGWMDGHSLSVPMDFDETEFRKALTRAGKEVRDLEKWRK
jgi:hypothetical protein